VIHYHGTPITPRFELQRMAGKNFCVSFANAGDADECLRMGQSIMWDNGAFTIWKSSKDKNIDWNKFYAWLETRLGHPHWGVVPDVIQGTAEQNIELIQQWPFPKSLSGVVWHMNEGLDHLLRLIELGFSKICFGSTDEYDPIGCPAWERLMDFIFNELERRGILRNLWIHMMRGLSLCGDVYPFASADSTNVARNFKNIGERVDPERMARRIDSVQCPIRWTIRPTQKDMFNAAV
jgi:hypothetical protein